MIDIVLIDGPLDGPDTPAQRHARAMVAAIERQGSRSIAVHSLPVFTDRLTTSATRVSDALFESADRQPSIVLCSLGLPRRDSRMISALDRCVDAGVRVVASRPARSTQAVWPAAHRPVFAVQGDARCQPSQYSCLGPERWFGACPALDDQGVVAGASVAAAHFAGILARLLVGALSDSDQAGCIDQWLYERAHWRERERRLAR